MKRVAVNPVLILSLFIVLSFSFQVSFKNCEGKINPGFTQKFVLEFLPERVRSFLSGILWSYADEYMHSGPSVRFKDSPYQAGSYAGNTEVTSLMRQIISLTPDQQPPYKILAMNLARYLSRFNDGLRILQFGIIFNSDQKWVHELYAAAAFQYLFDFRDGQLDKEIPLRYLDKAILLAKKNGFVANDADPIFSMENYIILKLRLLVDLKNDEEAVRLWNLYPELHKKMGFLGEVLQKLANGERAPERKPIAKKISGTLESDERFVSSEANKNKMQLPMKAKQPTWSRPAINLLKSILLLSVIISICFLIKKSSV